MKKIVFNAPGGWAVTDKTEPVEDEGLGTLDIKQEIHVTPDRGNIVRSIDLSFYPDENPEAFQEAKECMEMNLERYLELTMPQFYRVYFSGQFLFNVESGGKRAWYYVCQEQGECSATVEFALDFQPDHHIVFGSVEVNSTLYELESIMRDVVERISLQDA